MCDTGLLVVGRPPRLCQDGIDMEQADGESMHSNRTFIATSIATGRVDEGVMVVSVSKARVYIHYTSPLFGMEKSISHCLLTAELIRMPCCSSS